MATEPNASDLDEPLREGPERPPRGARTMAIVRWILVVAVAALAGFVWLSYASTRLSTAGSASGKLAPKYQCPMHPEVVSDAPGECPICHMSLELVAPDRGPADADAGAATTDAAAPLRAPRAASSTRAAVGSVPPGTMPVKLALDRVQSIGVRTALASEHASAEVLRVTATVVPPDHGVCEVHVRSPGFVEAIHVDQTGVGVGAGQTMLSVYSPEIYQAENELVLLGRWAGDGGAAPSAAPSAAARKLELLGMAPAEIERVIARREPLRAIAITAPRGGFVTKKNVVLGSYVTPETVLYELWDLSTVYVVADVLLADSVGLRAGIEGRFVPAGHPDDAVAAKIDLVYPLANAEARTRRVRMQIPNRGGQRYAPGEFGTVHLSVAPRAGVSVPRDAVVETGTSTYVFVVDPGGRFVPRVVAVGARDGDQVVVAEGLAPGERVVSGATFLIDSESRLQASIAEAARP